MTYSLAISESEVPKDIVESYRVICGGIIGGLKLLGIRADFKPINDILVNGKKISGNAQTRRDGVVLQHGTILVDLDVRKMFTVLMVPQEKIRDKLIKSVGQRVTSLKKELGRDITLEELGDALLKGFGSSLETRFEKGVLNPEEISTAEKLFSEKYSTKQWCYLR